MYKGGRPQKSVWEHFFHVTVDKKNMLNARNVVASNAARMQVHYTKCTKDSASNPEPVMLAREKRPRSTSRSGSPPRKCLVIETQGDIDSHVVKTSAKFKLTMDIEIANLFDACNLPFSI
jgi:hypothetical protein